MADFSLARFEAEIDSGKTGPAEVKAAAAVMYATATKEAVLHIRMHAQVVVNDATSTPAQKTAAQAVLTVTAPLAARSLDDPRWLELARGQ